MPIWPFTRRKRSAVADDKRPAPAADTPGALVRSPSLLSRVQSKRSRTSSRNDHEFAYSASNALRIQEPVAIVEIQPQKQQHEISYIITHNATTTGSSDSSQQPRKRSSLIRKLSKLSKSASEKEKQSPPVAFLTRRSSKKSERSRYDRPLSPGSTAPRMSMDSQISSRAYKIRKLDVFIPHPTLQYDECSLQTANCSVDFGNPKLVPSRSTSRRTNSRTTQTQTWRYKGPLIQESITHGSHARVNDLADELDSRGLREAMERDQRRRKRKKEEYEEQLRVKFAKASRQDDVTAGPSRHAYPSPEPIQWSGFNTDPSLEHLADGLGRFASGPEALTRDITRSPEVQPQEPVHEEPPVNNPLASPISEPSEVSSWTSYVRRQTGSRVRKEPYTPPAVVPPPPDISEHPAYRTPPISHGAEGLHRRERRTTPGRHIPNEIALAMAAVETGRLQEKYYQDDSFDDELRDSVYPTPPPETYHDSNRSRSSLAAQRRGGTTPNSHSPIIFDDPKDSQTPYTRPPSVQRYSPSFNNRHSSGSPTGGRPRSVMSTSLASIDSEGSWLSGKIGTRRSVQQLSPLRSSASSLRRRYRDLEGDVDMGDDEYFTASKDEDANETSQLNLEDSEDEEESVSSEDERNMWRQGTEKRVQLASPTRAMSRQAVLDAFDDELQSSSATPVAAEDDEETFVTPFENPDPFIKTTTPEFQTPLENPGPYHAM